MTAHQAALTALADPTRRSILEIVAAGSRSVGALAAELPISRPAVSQHLRVLREAGLVRAEAQGTRHVYALDPTGLTALRDYLDRFWSDSLAAFAREAEARPPHHPSHGSDHQENR
ncbi:DNA-binding transcriptional ArsR family regulator [Friedmanniella endophytica]|uniref:DNA-binding transcriptional ArsR family regulator n=1 Tax=Microlunatus kandeliicorticis TaxID=1759536 RepID=A0A7W3P7K8_9ACTN|nr:metalloregulator ArsR/SmtB family transcription factor [Microlunatus kandeliicorticis]MBA8796139.1 DNA-binding transcriptional ArsR family regulator [Microlunatus kandeliicorticis]